MNKDGFEGRWQEMWSQVKAWWGELTDDELGQAGNRADPLVDLLQEKCGYSRECAEAEFERRLKGVKNAVKKG